MGKMKTPIVRVGEKRRYGRGFWVGSPDFAMIITAAHCLPHYPPRLGSISYVSDRTYVDLISSLDGKRKCSAECLFLDPISDLAVFGCPEDELWEGYMEFANESDFLEIAPLASGETSVRVMYDDSKSIRRVIGVAPPSRANFYPRNFWIHRDEGGENRIKSGMSGSPILTDDGKAVGVLCNDDFGPLLSQCLPQWIY